MRRKERKKEKNVFSEIDKRNGRTHIVVSRYWPDGERFRRRCPNLTAARDLLARINGAIATGTWREYRNELTKTPKSPLTVGEFADIYLNEYCRVFNTRPEFKEHALKPVRRIIGNVRLEDLRRGDVYDFIEERAEEVAPATVNRSVSVLNEHVGLCRRKGTHRSAPPGSVQDAAGG